MKTANRISGQIGEFPIDLENIFDHFFGDKRPQPSRGFVPGTDVVESETSFEIHMELPGVGSDDVTVEVADGKLLIGGQKNSAGLEEGAKHLRKERVYGDFHRAFEFDTQVDFDKIEATFDAGVLKVVLPKSEKVLPRKIDIQVKS